MTTLLVWTAHDARRFSALHVATDSRISWGSGDNRWDAGRKIFASKTTPDIWAYTGDVVFPALILSQIVNAAEHNLLFSPDTTPAERHNISLNTIKNSFKLRHNAPKIGFTVLHASRDSDGKSCKPLLWKTTFDQHTETWDDKPVVIPDKPIVVELSGSGTVVTGQELNKWRASDIGGTSRSIYSAFCASIKAGRDPLSGGPPQLASIYSRYSAKTIGTVHDSELFLHGFPIPYSASLKKIEWFDDLFQRIDPETRRVLAGAARHAKPTFT